MVPPLSAIEPLEPRIAPASVNVNTFAKTATWLDWDGDAVKLKWTGATPPSFTTEDNGLGLLVDRIDLHNAKDALTLTVKAVVPGDGRIDLGHVSAAGLALKSWSSPKATVAEFDCGDNTTAIGSYLTGGMGIVPFTRFTGGNGDGVDSFNGSIGTFTVRGDFDKGDVEMNAGAGGKIGSILFTGSFRGDTPGGGENGYLRLAASKVGSFTLGGSLIGGGTNGGGYIDLEAPVDKVLIKGSVIGGSGEASAEFQVDATKSFVIGGSVLGGSEVLSGVVSAQSAASFILGGSIVGGPIGNAGYVGLGAAQTVLIKGSILGGHDVGSTSFFPTGVLSIRGSADSITVKGDLIAGTEHTLGTVAYNGAILVQGNVENLAIKGNILGNDDIHAFLLVGGVAPAKPGNYHATGKLTVGGDVQFAAIEAGQVQTINYSARLGAAENPDAGIGSVTVGGNWLHSSLTAGIDDTLNNGFEPSDTNSGGDPNRQAVIGAVVIKGDLIENPHVGGASGFGAQKIASITVGGAKVFKTGDAARFLDPFGYVLAKEV